MVRLFGARIKKQWLHSFRYFFDLEKQGESDRLTVGRFLLLTDGKQGNYSSPILFLFSPSKRITFVLGMFKKKKWLQGNSRTLIEHLAALTKWI